jgi:putative salt-induced outer membrane protein YdiY
MLPGIRLLLFILALFAAVGSAAAAQENPPVSDTLRVVLQCAEDCGQLEVRQQISYVEWVGDTTAADVHIVDTRFVTSVDAQSYEFVFVGLGAFAGKVDTLTYVASTSDADAERAALAHTIELGLVRYAAATTLARQLHIRFSPTDEDTVAFAREPTAQPLSVQPPPIIPQNPVPPPKRWAVALDLGFTGSSGNSELIALSTGIRMRHLETKVFQFDGSASFRYGETQGRVAARQIQMKLAFEMGPDARVAPFVSLAGERDPFRKFDLRSKLGTGIRYGFYKSDRGELLMRAAVQYSHERFTPQADLAATSDGAWSFELKGMHQLGSNLRLENASSFDPVMGDMGDYILDVKSRFNTRITSHLALTLGHTYTYDSTPVQDVRPTDQRFEAGLTIDF